jgi:hypothetical protein
MHGPRYMSGSVSPTTLAIKATMEESNMLCTCVALSLDTNVVIPLLGRNTIDSFSLTPTSRCFSTLWRYCILGESSVWNALRGQSQPRERCNGWTEHRSPGVNHPQARVRVDLANNDGVRRHHWRAINSGAMGSALSEERLAAHAGHARVIHSCNSSCVMNNLCSNVRQLCGFLRFGQI